MIKLVILITITLIAVIIGISFLSADSGYVYIKVRDVQIEMSLLLLFILVLVLMVCVHYVWKLMNKVTNLKSDIEIWRHHRNMEQAHIRLSNGFIELGNGNYSKAQKILTSAAAKTKYSLVPLVAAANAAQQQGNENMRNFLLNKALEENAGAKLSLSLTKADYLMNLGEYDKSQAVLDGLGKKIKHNALAMKIQAHIYSRTTQWDKLMSLIPKLNKKTNLSQEEIAQLEYQAHRYQLINANDTGAVKQQWRKIPKFIRAKKGMLVEYVHKLQTNHDFDTAAEALSSALEKQFDEDLALLYAGLSTHNSAKQIRRLELLIKAHPDNAKLNLAIAKLYAKKELWVIAKDKVKTSIALENSLEAQKLLTHIKERIAQHEA